jgi:hypothetical protein
LYIYIYTAGNLGRPFDSEKRGAVFVNKYSGCPMLENKNNNNLA